MTVNELFKRLVNRLPHSKPTISFVDAAHSVQVVITRRLVLMKSDLLRDTWESDEQAASVSVVDLPLDMVAAGDNKDTPYISYLVGSDTVRADLIPLSRARGSFVVPGNEATPREYDIRGNILEMFPTSSVAYTLFVPMYRQPPPLVDMNDELPWNGFFDHIFQDSVLALSGPAGISSLVTPALDRSIMRAVDETAVLRTGRRAYLLYA